jgi:hypothetical protein
LRAGCAGARAPAVADVVEGVVESLAQHVPAVAPVTPTVGLSSWRINSTHE